MCLYLSSALYIQHGGLDGGSKGESEGYGGCLTFHCHQVGLPNLLSYRSHAYSEYETFCAAISIHNHSSIDRLPYPNSCQSSSQLFVFQTGQQEGGQTLQVVYLDIDAYIVLRDSISYSCSVGKSRTHVVVAGSTQTSNLNRCKMLNQYAIRNLPRRCFASQTSHRHCP